MQLQPYMFIIISLPLMQVCHELCIRSYRRFNELQITPVGILCTALWRTDFLVWLFTNYDTLSYAEPFNALYVPLSLTFRNSTLCLHSACMFVVRFSQKKKQRLLPCSNALVFITKTGSFYCAVRIESVKVILAAFGV